MRYNKITQNKTGHPLASLLWAMGLLVLLACKTEGLVDEVLPDDVTPIPTQLQLSSRVFENEGYLPNQYHYPGFSEGAQNLAPPLEWSQVSEETKSLLLFMYDHDAPDRHHWLIYDIPRTTQGILDGFNVKNYLNASSLVGGAVAIKGGTDKGYYGPSPHHGIHTYTIMLVELQDEAMTLSSKDQSRTISHTDQSELGDALVEFIHDGATAIAYHGRNYPVLGYRTLKVKAALAYPAFDTPSSIVGRAGETVVAITFKEELGSVDSTKISVHTGESIEQAQTVNPITSTSIDGKVLTLNLTDTLQSGDYIVVRFDTGAVTNKASNLSNQVPLTINTQVADFTLSVASMEEGDELPSAYRSDGDAQSPPLYWAHPPTNTQSFVLLLYHDDIDVTNHRYGDAKHIWLLYNIPPTLSSLTKNVNPSDYNIGIIQGGNEYGYRPPELNTGTKQYRLVIVALDKMILKAHVEHNYQANYLQRYGQSFVPGAFFNDNDRNPDTKSLAGLAYSVIDYVEGKSSAFRYDGGITPYPYKVLGIASFDMTISYHASTDGPKIDMEYYNYLLNNRNAGPFIVLENFSSSDLNNQIWLAFDEIITLADTSKFIIKKSINNNLQVIPTTVSPYSTDDDNQIVTITLGTNTAPVLTSPFDVFDITIQEGAVKNSDNYFNQDISLSYTVQVPEILGTNNYYLDINNNTLDIFFKYPVMAPVFVSTHKFIPNLFSLKTGPVNNSSANTITSITANGSVLTLGYTNAIHTNDEIYVSIGKKAIIDAEMGYPNYHALVFKTTVPSTISDNIYPVLEEDPTIQNNKLGVANNIYAPVGSSRIQVLFNKPITLVDASSISVQSKSSSKFYSHVALHADNPIEITGSDNDILTIHLADVISSDIQQLRVKINASAVQSIQSSVNNYYIVVNHDVYTPQLIDDNPLATSVSTKTVALSFRRRVDIVDYTKISAYMTGANDEQIALQIESSSIQVAGNNQDILQFELPAFPTMGETLTVNLATGALKDSMTQYKNVTIEVSKKYEGLLPFLDSTFQVHAYSIPSSVDIPHNNNRIHIVFDTEEDLEIIETGLASPYYHLPHSLISIRKGTDKNALKSVGFSRDFYEDSIAMKTILDYTEEQSSVKRALTLIVDDNFNTNGEYVEIIIEPEVVRNSAGANEKIIINTQIVVPSVKNITAAKNSTSITIEFNREVIYINPCVSFAENWIALLQANSLGYVTRNPASESITSIYDGRYVDTTSSSCDYDYDATASISGQRSISVERAGGRVYPDFQISDDHKTITLTLSAPITESSLPLDIGPLGIADRYSKQAMDSATYTVTVP